LWLVPHPEGGPRQRGYQLEPRQEEAVVRHDRQVVANGKTKNGLAMPAYKGTLTARQMRDLAAFVYISTHK
jgi:mono/diheme cytochrome c family protein